MMSKSLTKQPVRFVTLKKDWLPHAYQERGIRFLLQTLYAGLILDPGLGKTSISLATIQILLKEKAIKRALIVAPLRVCHLVWPAEIEKWANFNGLKVCVLHGPDKAKLASTDADIFVINPEGLKWLFDRRGQVLKKLGCDLLVIDESTKFKNAQALRFKGLRPYLHLFKRRWILTGTPAPNGLLDLWAQAYIMDRGYALSPYVTHYRTEYFAPAVVASVVHGEDEHGHAKRHQEVRKWVPMHNAEERIYERLRSSTLRMEAADYLELPQLIENTIRVELPGPAMKSYRELEKTLVTQVAGGLVTAVNAAVAMGKCRQMASGGIYKQYDIDELIPQKSKREWNKIHDCKTEALVDLVESLQGSPILVAYEFQHDLWRIQEALGKDIPYIGSGVSTNATKAIEAAWNRGEFPVLLGHPSSMGHGLNLQEAGNQVCWYTPTWNLEEYEQYNKRVLRQGNKNAHVTVHRIVAKGTIDEMILGLIQKKQKGQNALLSALKNFAVDRK